MTTAQPAPRGTSWHSGTSLTPEVWRRLLEALDAGTPTYVACLYAGISPAVWEREKQRIPEFAEAANRVEMSGLVAAWRFLQLTAASEWRASLELIKLYGATRGRDLVRVEELDTNELDADLTPDAVAAVIRILRAHEFDVGGVGSLPNGRHAAAESNRQVAE